MGRAHVGDIRSCPSYLDDCMSWGSLRQVRLQLLRNSPRLADPGSSCCRELLRNKILHLLKLEHTDHRLLLHRSKKRLCLCNGHGFCGLGRISRCRMAMWSAHRPSGALPTWFCSRTSRPDWSVSTLIFAGLRRSHGGGMALSCIIASARSACCLGVLRTGQQPLDNERSSRSPLAARPECAA